MEKILVIDDDRTVCKSLELLLKKSGYEVKTVHQPAVAIEEIERFRPELILLDMNFSINTSGKQGLKMLEKILEFDNRIIVILITGWATLQLAVEGMKKGAKDFLAKPWDNKHLLSSLRTSLELYGQDLYDVDPGENEDDVIGQSLAFQKVMQLVERVAPTDASVLITGASGTGKEVIAERIHNTSKRSEFPFVKVNLGGISTSLFESEMFGHKKGAFTDASMDRDGRFAKAEGGTIFLDEIGDLPLESQVKLLRVLQEKTYEILGSSKTVRTDCRVISATHKNLEELVQQNIFREDLYYRVNLIRIHLPDLADRKEDIPLLVRHFAKKICASYELELPLIEDSVLEWLSHQNYEGNIRQLRNLVERTILLAPNTKHLSIKDFQANLFSTHLRSDTIALPNIGEITLDEMESRMIQKALNYHNHSVSKTAKSLGLTRSSLYRRMEKYGIN